MSRFFSLLVLAAVVTFGAVAQTSWKVDPSHSNVRFTVKHLGISNVSGTFRSFSGAIAQTDKAKGFDGATIDVAIETKSINTDNDNRDNHLRSADFFEAEKYPSITFKNAVLKKGKNNTYSVTGDLTVKDITKKVTFEVALLGEMPGFDGKMRTAFTGSTTVNRFDYNLKWANALSNNTLVVGADVKVDLDIQLVAQ